MSPAVRQVSVVRQGGLSSGSPIEGQVSFECQVAPGVTLVRCQDGAGWGVPNRGTVSVFSWRCWLCAIQSMNVFSQRAPTSTSRLFGEVSGQCVLFKCMQSRSGRPTKCFKRFHQVPMWSLAGCFDASGSFVMCVSIATVALGHVSA